MTYHHEFSISTHESLLAVLDVFVPIARLTRPNALIDSFVSSSRRLCKNTCYQRKSSYAKEELPHLDE